MAPYGDREFLAILEQVMRTQKVSELSQNNRHVVLNLFHSMFTLSACGGLQKSLCVKAVIVSLAFAHQEGAWEPFL
jgi:hypothetical protein